MANDLSDLMNTYILPMALPVLRESCMMPALVSRDYDAAAHEKNAVIRVPLPQDLGPAQDFDPTTGSSSTDLKDPKVDITLDQWKYKQFQMNDKEMRESVTSAVLPSAVDAAVRSIANAVDLSLLGLYKTIPGHVGAVSGGVTKDTLIDARRALGESLVPAYPRYALWNTLHESELLKSITNWSDTGEIATTALRQANMGTLLGFDSYVDQLMLAHTPGTATGDVLSTAGASVAGATSIPVGGTTGTKTLKAGDVFSIAGVKDSYGSPKPFVVTGDIAAVGGVYSAVSIAPALPVDVADNSALTFVVAASPGASVPQSLAFHRDAFMLAMRTLTNEQSETSTIAVQVDPVSGIPLRLETWRDPNKATRMWRFDVLYGVKTIRPEFAERMFG